MSRNDLRMEIDPFTKRRVLCLCLLVNKRLTCKMPFKPSKSFNASISSRMQVCIASFIKEILTFKTFKGFKKLMRDGQ
jgi:hypothetical protein